MTLTPDKSMRIEQVVIDFHAPQDRLLLSVHTDGPSMRVWLTRRFVRLMLKTLAEILQAQVRASQPLAVGSPALLAELMHERALQGLDLSTPPVQRHQAPDADDSSGALPEESDAMDIPQGWLAYQLRTTWQDNDKPTRRASAISIFPAEGSGLTLNLDNDFPHALARMLSQACQSAQWDLDFSPLGISTAPGLAQQGSAHLH